MARIEGVDLPRNKRIEVALTYIYGVGLAGRDGVPDLGHDAVAERVRRSH